MLSEDLLLGTFSLFGGVGGAAAAAALVAVSRIIECLHNIEYMLRHRNDHMKLHQSAATNANDTRNNTKQTHKARMPPRRVVRACSTKSKPHSLSILYTMIMKIGREFVLPPRFLCIVVLLSTRLKYS